MNSSTAPAIKPEILKGLRKDCAGLITKLTADIPDPAFKSKLKENLEHINTNLQLEATAQEQRKALSRQIGPARKNNQDCSELIEQVAELSANIDTINTEINQQIVEIENDIQARSTSPEDNAPRSPQHFFKCSNFDTQPLHEDLSISSVQASNSSAWQAFVQKTPNATIYHDFRWSNIIKNNFKHDCHYLCCKDNAGEIVGVYPLVHLKSRLFGSFTISMPYVNYGGPLATSYAAEEALLSYASTLSDSVSCSHMEVRETQARDKWKSVQRKVSMILPLPDNDEELDSRLGSKIRAQVKKAKEHELEIQFGGVELLNQFYRVFSHNMRDLGTPVYGKSFFKDILMSFSEDAFLAIASRHGKPLAAGFLLGYRDKLEIPWASSIRSKNHLGANMYMYRQILKEAIHLKYRYFDFGRSTKDASTYKFKKQWGAQEHPLHWHYWTPDNGELPQINPDNPKYKLVIKTWQQLPVMATQLIGPFISRNLP